MFVTTTWRDAKQFGVGLTTRKMSEIYIDKIAVWVYRSLKGEIDVTKSKCDKCRKLHRFIKGEDLLSRKICEIITESTVHELIHAQHRMRLTEKQVVHMTTKMIRGFYDDI